MFKISDFSKLSQVSARTLRYYEEMNLLKPARVDPFTGYRYYTIDQLPRLNRIVALKDLGFELAEIAELVNKDMAMEQIQALLQLKRRELEARVQADLARMGRIDAQLRLMETKAQTYDILLKKVEAQTIVSCTQVGYDFMPTFDLAARLYDLTRQQRVQPVGALHYIYHDSDPRDNIVHVEAAVPVPAVSSAHEPLTLRRLDAEETMATLLYQGSPYSIFEAYQTLGTWIDANAYTITGACRKICHHCEGDYATYLTEIQFPVAKRH